MNTQLHLIKQGLFFHNPALFQLLGLCPLLAITTSCLTAIGLGLATLLALVMSSMMIASIKQWIANDLRLPILVVIIASCVTTVQFLLQAFAFQLYQQLGIFLALITTNCTILARCEAFARKSSVIESFCDAVGQGCGFLWVLTLVGSIREIIGHGTLFSGVETMITNNWHLQHMNIFPSHAFLLAILPPGGFLILGAILAFIQYLKEDT